MLVLAKPWSRTHVWKFYLRIPAPALKTWVKHSEDHLYISPFSTSSSRSFDVLILSQKQIVLLDSSSTGLLSFRIPLEQIFSPGAFNAWDKVGKICFSQEDCRTVLHWGNQRPTARWECVPKKKNECSVYCKPPKWIISSITLSQSVLKESAIYHAMISLLPVSSQETLLKFISPQK